jgi:predicted AlkP superfamily pyrophosphatase or phosphodiesterase
MSYRQVAGRCSLRRLGFSSLALLLSLLVALLFLPAKGYAKSLVIIGWDGAGLSNVEPLLKGGSLPNLRRILKDRNGHVIPMTGMARTDTCTNWTQILAGTTPDQSGVIGTKQYKDKQAMPLTWTVDSFLSPAMNYWYFHLPKEWSIFYPLQKTLNIQVGFFVSKPYLDTNLEDGPLALISASARESAYFPLWQLGDAYIDDVEQAALNFIAARRAKGEDFFLFVHTNPDKYGHRYGEGSARYHQEFVRSDKVVGSILDAIEGLTDVKVIVTDDHGFDKSTKGHKNANDLWMVTDLPLSPVYFRNETYPDRALAKTIDILPTVWQWWGIDKADYEMVVRPKIRGNSMLK